MPRRAGRHRNRAAGYRRPYGEVLATDVKAPSLFGEPRRIIDKDEAIVSTATLPIPTPQAQPGRRRRRFVWLKREITPLQQQEIHRLGVPALASCARTSAFGSTGAEVAHLIGLVISTTGHRRDGEMA